ncbi:high-affinity nickel permease [Gluconacetobacter johannae DSM 13595]|nr:high-affinity nickel permease [Gluconacetobacter johannae DSM 13595]
MDAGSPATAPGAMRALLAGLAAVNIAAWGWAEYALGAQPVLMASALLAWTFGLRHAMDADHIAAIDVVTRKLMTQGRRPLWVGLSFSLGHSSVVILATLLLAVVPAHGWLDRWHLIGGTVGSVVSISFLLVMALANMDVALTQWRALRAGAGAGAEPSVPGGLLVRLFHPAFRLVSRGWQMYPLGFLFGLGFDTATEIGLLGLTAAHAAHGLGLAGVMVFPLLFTAGMALVDSIDAMLMIRAFGWSARSGRRRMVYNLVVTLASVMAAVAVGLVEAVQMLGDDGAAPAGLAVRAARVLGDHFPAVGLGIAALFLAIWAVSAGLDRLAPARRP